MKYALLLLTASALAQPTKHVITPREKALEQFRQSMEYYGHSGVLGATYEVMDSRFCFGKHPCGEIRVYPDGRIRLRNISLRDAFLYTLGNQVEADMKRQQYEDSYNKEHPHTCSTQDTDKGQTVTCVYPKVTK